MKIFSLVVVAVIYNVFVVVVDVSDIVVIVVVVRVMLMNLRVVSGFELVCTLIQSSFNKQKKLCKAVSRKTRVKYLSWT